MDDPLLGRLSRRADGLRRRVEVTAKIGEDTDYVATSRTHAKLIELLQDRSTQSWSGSALLACLQRLAAGGPTEGQLIHVEDAWALCDVDGICVVYNHGSGPLVGVRVLRTSSSGHPLYLDAAGAGDMDDPDDFGREVADYVIAEPLGTIAHELVSDSNGVGWWGEPPFPPERSLR